MTYFLNLPVWKKLILVFLLVGLLPMAVIGYQALVTSNEIIVNQVSNQLSAVRSIKAKEVTRYFERVRNQIQTLSADPQIIRIASEMPSAFREFRSETGLNAVSTEQQKASVTSYYHEKFAQQYEKLNGTNADIPAMLKGLDSDSWALQYQYISNNPYALGEKDSLNRANDGSEYSRLHESIHPKLRNYLNKFGYYDIFIADAISGDIIYSVFKELDYTTSLIDGPYADTSIGKAFRDALDLTEPDSSTLADFRTYLPSYDAPASFMASPISNGSDVVGVLIFQMPIEDINAIMGERSGMGETGESYLVGSDKLMRSDSYLEPEYHSVVASFKNPEKGAITTEAVHLALSGDTGSEIITDYLGNPVLSAYMPLDLGEFRWAVIAEQDVAEAFSPVSFLKKIMLVTAIICLSVVLFTGWSMARLISAPITRVMNSISAAEKTGAFSQKVNYQSRDEIGQMANAFDGFLDRLSDMFRETNSVLNSVNKGDYTSRINAQYQGDMKLLCDGINFSISTIDESHNRQLAQQREIERAAEQARKEHLTQQEKIEKSSEEARRNAKEATAAAKDAAAAAEEAAAAAEEANRIRQALDVATTAVLMADNKGDIIYANHAMQAVYKRLIKTIGMSHCPGDILSANVRDFRDSSSRGESLEKLVMSGEKMLLSISEFTFWVEVSEVLNNGKPAGTVIEWIDRTHEIATEKEIDTVVEAAAAGDFSVSISEAGKEGFFLSLARGLNSMTSRTSEVIGEVAEVMSSMAEGDLTREVKSSYSGTFGQLANSINSTTGKLVSVIRNINETASQVSSGAREIEAGVIDLAARTEQQAASLEETASSMNEMATAVSQSAKNAASADDRSKSAESRASEGGEIVHKAVVSMEAINSASKQIADIIGVIDDIAFQTNLLALNAAVEAARAGEQGRGFAVVASEVRQLAQRSSQAAREIKDLINDSVEKVEQGTRLVNLSGDTLKEIVSSVEEVSQMISGLSSSTREQELGINQVNSAISRMDEMTQQNSALVEEATAASENMAAQAKIMVDSVAFFRVSP